ncbi:CRAL-TRIO domain-containing protein [Irpex rosettiformis]|uniref:CRAL-TRIO domain-containing protein n=1 Tax=Irpex rosettiformis TaxID=378272 RepID=A0ACB8UFP5_9APHY|nr:CRAL-TRIO domain-containing protein [Irpex rosettiformis]
MPTVERTKPSPPLVLDVDELLEVKDTLPALTAKQNEMINAVLAHFMQEGYALPGAEEGNGALKDVEEYWLSYECMLRYLRATKWASSQAAIDRLESTLLWRREFGIIGEKGKPEYVEPEALTGKVIAYGYDNERRPALYLLPSRQNTSESTKQFSFTFWFLERCIELMGPGVETVALMINYGDKSPKSPSLSHSRNFLNLLQSHYPERLGRALITNVPFFLTAFYKVITPFVDPATRTKVFFNPRAVEQGLFKSEELFKEFSGDVEFEYKHEEYWEELLRMTDKIRERRLEAWRALGGTIGISEWDIKTWVSPAEGGEKEVVKENVTVTISCGEIQQGVAV